MYQNNLISCCRRFFLIRPFSLFLLLKLSLLLLVVSCEESSFIGLEVQPSADRFTVKSYMDNMIGSSLLERDSILAVDHAESLLGVHHDPVFGRLNASFLTQAGIFELVNFGDQPVFDSLILYLHVKSHYGAIAEPQEIKIYEIIETIDPDSAYYSNLDPGSMIDNQDILATHTVRMSESDTLMRIPITSVRFQDKLLYAPASATQSLEDFLAYFKGLYVSAELAAGEGSVFNIDLNSDNSKMSLYYRRSDTLDTSTRYDFVINRNANRINVFDRDYTSAAFYDHLGETGTGDSLTYVQGASGVMTRLDFENVLTWRDSMPVSINLAQLYLPVDEIAVDYQKYPVPPRIVLFERDEEGRYFGVIDLTVGDNFFGGSFNAEEGYYSMNITNWVHALLNGRKDISTLYVSVRESGVTPNGAVLRTGSHSSGGPHLEITYTKH
jgi:hypothetical protein